ncbi:hypothetical protein ACGFIH_03220 [Micromonospora parva]|uniref:hypothetical protein n=1 Tax=Micromonospora parva TaxID=1464048 RepID=UPI00371E82DE
MAQLGVMQAVVAQVGVMQAVVAQVGVMQAVVAQVGVMRVVVRPQRCEVVVWAAAVRGRGVGRSGPQSSWHSSG